MTTVRKAERRTQQERTAAARDNLIRATQDCLATLGLARTTVGEICKRAGVSSGALLHHFPSKNALIVTASIQRQIELIDDTVRRAQIGHGTIRDEADEMRQLMAQTFPLSYEFFWALRTDENLRREFQSQLQANEGAFTSRYTVQDSDLKRSGEPLIVRMVLACFLRGLLLEALMSDAGTVERIYEVFVEAMTAFVRLQTPGGRAS
ncbi:TetR/AcrR family transcriptional regulator [Sphingomonas hankookensis]|uniref:TetR/AcrR family transcriptional regulator n=1 Tax=Sphingomonas hankookensis TaxID=563996 RepID=UPI001F55AB29|nr:TetR/AcrR family transcriptional regulator [Sphingomonas hankookensis]